MFNRGIVFWVAPESPLSESRGCSYHIRDALCSNVISFAMLLPLLVSLSESEFNLTCPAGWMS